MLVRSLFALLFLSLLLNICFYLRKKEEIIYLHPIEPLDLTLTVCKPIDDDLDILEILDEDDRTHIPANAL